MLHSIVVTDTMALKAVNGDHCIREINIIRWERLLLGWTELNSDGSFNSTTGMASEEGVLRNSKGAWIGGFSMNIGYCSKTGAELWELVMASN